MYMYMYMYAYIYIYIEREIYSLGEFKPSKVRAVFGRTPRSPDSYYVNRAQTESS